jgi:flagellar basal body rod protein FlgC
MSINLSTALSGISAANERLRASASNLATQSSAAAHKREQVELSSRAGGGGVEARSQVINQPVVPAHELVEQQSATYAFVANLRVLQTQLRPEGGLLDIKA